MGPAVKGASELTAASSGMGLDQKASSSSSGVPVGVYSIHLL